MKGRAYEYGKQAQVVQSYVINIEDETFALKTNKYSYDRKFDSAADFFKYWYDSKENLMIDKVSKNLEAEAPKVADILLAMLERENGLADELIKILKDNIEKVQKTPAYIPQASSVEKNVSTILNVQKVKLDMYRTIKGKR